MEGGFLALRRRMTVWVIAKGVGENLKEDNNPCETLK